MKAIFTQGGIGISGTYTASDGDGNRASVRCESGMQLHEKHRAAVLALCEKMGWKGNLIGGHVLKAGRTVGRVWLWDDHRAERLAVGRTTEPQRGLNPAAMEDALRFAAGMGAAALEF